jgi:hypothetical protein
MHRQIARGFVLTAAIVFLAAASSAADLPRYDYRVLATSKTSTMEKEINEAADAGYQFHAVMGGETAVGGKEAVVIMGKKTGEESKARKKYKLLATSKTSTMQKEMQQAGDEGFEYRDQTVFQSAFGGREVVVIMEMEAGSAKRVEYKLLATTKTSTMQKELQEAGEAGFALVGLTVAKTAMGGSELVSILRRDAQSK